MKLGTSLVELLAIFSAAIGYSVASSQAARKADQAAQTLRMRAEAYCAVYWLLRNPIADTCHQFSRGRNFLLEVTGATAPLMG